MAPSKRKQQRKADKKARQHRARQRAGQPSQHPPDRSSQQPLHQREDRHVLIAMTLASLVAGLLAIVNLDRATHAGSLSKAQRLVSTSRHGWPLVYLERDIEKTPQIYFSKRLYSWPLPAVEGEQRRWNFGNLAGNVGISIAMILSAYAMISLVVRKYDAWKKRLKNPGENARPST